MYVALKIKMNDRKLMLRKVKTGNLMTSQRLSESQTKQSYPCAKAHNVSHENKGDHFSKYILISPDGER